MTWNIGDKVVYPSLGVGTITSIEQQAIEGSIREVYRFQADETALTVMIPVDNAKKIGIREVISPEEVSEIFNMLSERHIRIINRPWNRRQKEYNEKFRSGNIFKIAEVLRELHILMSYKKLSFGEKKFYESAKVALVREISISKNTDVETAEQELNAYL